MRDVRGGTGSAHLKNISEKHQYLEPREAHEWLPAGLANDVLGGLIALQLTLAAFLRALSSITLPLLLRFSSLARGSEPSNIGNF